MQDMFQAKIIQLVISCSKHEFVTAQGQNEMIKVKDENFIFDLVPILLRVCFS